MKNIFLTALAKAVKLIFSNVDHRPTVYKTGFIIVFFGCLSVFRLPAKEFNFVYFERGKFDPEKADLKSEVLVCLLN